MTTEVRRSGISDYGSLLKGEFTIRGQKKQSRVSKKKDLGPGG